MQTLCSSTVLLSRNVLPIKSDRVATGFWVLRIIADPQNRVTKQSSPVGDMPKPWLAWLCLQGLVVGFKAVMADDDKVQFLCCKLQKRIIADPWSDSLLSPPH